MAIILKLRKLNPLINFFCALEEDLQYLFWRERTSVLLPDYPFPVRRLSGSHSPRVNSTGLEGETSVQCEHFAQSAVRPQAVLSELQLPPPRPKEVGLKVPSSPNRISEVTSGQPLSWTKGNLLKRLLRKEDGSKRCPVGRTQLKPINIQAPTVLASTEADPLRVRSFTRHDPFVLSD